MSHHIQPFRALRGLRHDFFDDILDRPLHMLSQHGVNQVIGFPAVDVKDNGNSVTITANVPGLKANDIHIEVEGDTLTLSGRTEHEKEEGQKDGDYYYKERESGSFVRTLTLPAHVDRDTADAVTKNGVLTLTLKKIQGHEQRRINIREE